MNRIILILIATLMSPVVAIANEWQVVKVSQPTQYTIDKATWSGLKPGMVIPDKAWINTGPRGRVVLGHGTERIVLQPNTLASLVSSANGTMTNVAQQFGVVDVDVETKSYQHVTVQTPFLAAVVKGTKFAVTVGATSASVAVARGLVEVTAAEHGKRSYVGIGQTAVVDKINGMSVTGKGKKTIQSVAAKKSLVPAVAVETLASVGLGPSGVAGTDDSGSTAAGVGVDSDTVGSTNANADTNGKSATAGSNGQGNPHNDKVKINNGKADDSKTKKDKIKKDKANNGTDFGKSKNLL